MGRAAFAELVTAYATAREELGAETAAGLLVHAEGRRRRLRASWPAGAAVGDGLARRVEAAVSAVAPLDANGLGRVHEAALPMAARKRGGVFYTPGEVADGLVDLVLGGWAGGAVTVLDPGCGAGVMLERAARLVAARSGQRLAEVVATAVRGIDEDAGAVGLCRGGLWLAAGGRVEPAALEAAVVVGDVLGAPLPPCDAVVGNPPFRGRLAGAHKATPVEARRWRERFGAEARPFTDPAALVLAAAIDAVRPGGRVGLILPVSLLTARDAGPVRERVLRDARLVAVWLAMEPVFEAGVDVCALVLERGAGTGTGERGDGGVRGERGVRVEWGEGDEWSPIARCAGRGFVAAPPVSADPGRLAEEPTWAGLVADLRGIPAADLRSSGRLGAVAEVVAGFRDEFYGLAPHVVDRLGGGEDGGLGGGLGCRFPRLVTAGLVDPAWLGWGVVAARVAGRTIQAPRVDLEALEADSSRAGRRALRWVRRNSVPKLLVATQTRVVEAVADREGSTVPSVPVLAVHAPAARLDHLGAVLTGAPVSAWAASRFTGAGLSPKALRLAAADLARVPLPPPGRAWDAAAAQFAAASRAGDAPARREALERCSVAMCEAYGVAEPEAVLAWWRARLPPLDQPRHGLAIRRRFAS